MKHRRELTCTACGETIESEVFHCMSGDILCTDCMAFYVWRMFRYYPGEPPMSYYPGNLLSRIREYL